MIAATRPRTRRDAARLLVVAPNGALTDTAVDALPAHLAPGDVLVVNDAATVPGSLGAVTADGTPLEVRLAAQAVDGSWLAVTLGDGRWTTPTEHRGAPPPLSPGQRLSFVRAGARVALTATVTGVSALSPRLLTLAFDRHGAALWGAIYALGRPIQYAHLEHDLPLHAVQTPFAARPWALELPSAGYPLSFALLARLRQRGVTVARLTHAAGISATGDPAIDRALPLPERFEIPRDTVAAIARARREGGRVMAVGTSVVRALEASAARSGGLLPESGPSVATLRIGPSTELVVVDGLLTGMHSPGESHYELLGAFGSEALLARVSAHAASEGYRCHEFGDVALWTSRDGRKTAQTPLGQVLSPPSRRGEAQARAGAAPT